MCVCAHMRMGLKFASLDLQYLLQHRIKLLVLLTAVTFFEG